MVGGIAGVLVRVAVNAVALAVAAAVVEGIAVVGGTDRDRVVTLLVVAVVFGVVNAVVRPVVRLLALPLYLLTLGLITFVLNALMLLLTAWLTSQGTHEIEVDGFGSALAGSLVVTLVSAVLNLVLPGRD